MKILLATDGSEHSEAAARFLTGLHLTEEDEVTVLHVISWVPFRGDRASYHESLKRIKYEIAPKILDAAVEVLSPLGARLSTAFLEGSPERVIVDAAAKGGVDLVVLGSRGLTGLKSLVTGSVARAVAVDSPVPVLVVKQPRREVPAGMRVLFATDGGEEAEETARFLSTIPFREGTEVTVLHVVWSLHPDIPERYFLEMDDKVKGFVAEVRSAEFAESERIIERAKGCLAGRFPVVKGVTKVGDVSTEILNAAERLEADLIALGCRGLRGLKGRLGSVSRNVLSHSRCSVLVGKPC